MWYVDVYLSTYHHFGENFFKKGGLNEFNSITTDFTGLFWFC